MHTIDSRELGFAAIRQNSNWLCFSEPEIVLSTCSLNEIIPILNQLEELVAEDKYAVGFVGFEAARAFDSAFITHDASDGFPLIWFGIYTRVEVLSELPSPLDKDLSISEWSSSISKNDYRSNIKYIKQEIESGNTYQINYSFRQRALYTGDPYTAFSSFTDQHSSPYAAFINTGLFKVASLSPELFFSLDGSQITCRPMKGTAARGKTASEDKHQIKRLLSSSKDQAENLMIVDMIRNDLGRIAVPGSVSVDKLFTLETYETLFQMTTNVSARTDASFSDIFMLRADSDKKMLEFKNHLKKLSKNDVIISCSSGGAYTTFNQTFEQKIGQKIVNNKALASMGYGLSGAIGAAFANPKKRILHFEGDGGFTQNLQEYGTVAINKLNIKTFLFCDDGYASIRMTQKNYFGGAYMGCDISTKLGIPCLLYTSPSPRD